MGALELHLMAAKHAVQYVLQELPIGAQNKPGVWDHHAALISKWSDSGAQRTPSTRGRTPVAQDPSGLRSSYQEHIFEMTDRDVDRHQFGSRPGASPDWEEAASTARKLAWQDLDRRSACLGSVRQSLSGANDRGTFLDDLATQARRHGCGNCTEHTALAFQFLAKQFQNKRLYATPPRLEMLKVDPGKFRWDHDFLVIGRAARSELNKIATWGSEAVVCDPWWPVEGDRAYAAVFLKQKMRTDVTHPSRLDVESMLELDYASTP
jgi:hypothetical protein